MTEEQEAQLAAIAALFKPGESYVLRHDVPNTCRDKRKRYGPGLDAAPETLRKGWRFIARESHFPSPSVTLSCRHGDTPFAVSFGKTSVPDDLLAEMSDAERAKLSDAKPRHVLYVYADKEVDTALAILSALDPEPRSFETIKAFHEGSGYGFLAWRTLRLLVEQGKVTLDDVEAALNNIENDENEDD